MNDTKPNKGFENLCLASSTHLSYNFFKIMNLKCTILRYLASLILSTVAIYSIVIVAGMFGADYGFSPEGTFIIWILMESSGSIAGGGGDIHIVSISNAQ